nr:Kunitz type serine protease inhibitor 4 [Ancylostoma duodenale]
MKLSLIALCVLVYCFTVSARNPHRKGRCGDDPAETGGECPDPETKYTYKFGDCHEVKYCGEQETRNLFDSYEKCSGKCVIF